MKSVVIGRMRRSEELEWKAHWRFYRELWTRVTFGVLGCGYSWKECLWARALGRAMLKERWW